ncbi:MAG: ABC-2 family transporter protein [Acetobacteraceae bacterium]|nr:ABC-2 family transporter protein [Acetobacteraceae bacterium]
MVSRPLTSFTIEREIRSGEIAYLLVRPVSYMFHHCAAYLGERVVRLVLNLAVSSVVVAALTGRVALSPLGLLAYIPAVALGMLVDFAGIFMVGAAAFWMEDTAPVYWVYQRASMLLGGMLFPLDIFPLAAARVLRYLPFSFVVYRPAELAVAFRPRVLAGALAGEAGVCAAMMAVAWLVLVRGVRRLEARAG